MNKRAEIAYLTDFREEFEKGRKAQHIMTDMEEIFYIPMFNNEEYNKKHPEVMALYREIASSRQL